MAEWTRNKVDSDQLNGGNEWAIGDQVALEELNAMTNGGLYAQDFVEKLVENIDTSEINNVGTPTITLIDGDGATVEKPYKKFKFSNFKGEKGNEGEKGVGIDSIQDVDLRIQDGYTITKEKVTYEDGSEGSFEVYAKNGADSTSDYDELINKPIINDDLTTTNPTEVSTNQIYRHTGETTEVYVKGMLYVSNGDVWNKYGGEVSLSDLESKVDKETTSSVFSRDTYGNTTSETRVTNEIVTMSGMIGGVEVTSTEEKIENGTTTSTKTGTLGVGSTYFQARFSDGDTDTGFNVNKDKYNLTVQKDVQIVAGTTEENASGLAITYDKDTNKHEITLAINGKILEVPDKAGTLATTDDIISSSNTNFVTEEELENAKQQETLNANELYMTEDVSEDDSKANVNGSNLSDKDVEDWQNKLLEGTTIGKKQSLFGENVIGLNKSTMTTLKEYYDFIMSNPNKTFDCTLGKKDDTGPIADLLGNPGVNYTVCRLRTMCSNYEPATIEVFAIGLYIAKLYKGYIYRDYDSYYFTGWTQLQQ